MLLDNAYPEFYLRNALVGGCEVNLYDLTPQVSFQRRKLSFHECSVNVKSTCAVDIIDILCSFYYLDSLPGEDTIIGGKLDMVRHCRKKWNLVYKKYVSRKRHMIFGFQYLWRDFGIVKNHRKRGPVCCITLQYGNAGSVKNSALSMY